jgi:hypothetical protein
MDFLLLLRMLPLTMPFPLPSFFFTITTAPIVQRHGARRMLLLLAACNQDGHSPLEF